MIGSKMSGERVLTAHLLWTRVTRLFLYRLLLQLSAW